MLVERLKVKECIIIRWVMVEYWVKCSVVVMFLRMFFGGRLCLGMLCCYC